MPRRARLVVPGLPCHVTHRGNRRGDTFFSDLDRRGYLALLTVASSHYGLSIWAYCLMSNHVHLVVCPSNGDSLSRTIREVHGEHARRVHRRESLHGHLWANRYFSALLDPVHLWAAVRYVERNPVRAGLVTRAEEYPWSSAATHCGLAPRGPLASDRPFPGGVADWSSWLDEPPDLAADQVLRTSTARGLPAGTSDFVSALELRLGRNLSRGPRGRRPAKLGTGT